MLDWLRRLTRTEHVICREDLSAFLDERLSARGRQRVSRHLDECTLCRSELESLRQTVALLRAAPALKPPRSFFILMSETIHQRQTQQRRFAYVSLQTATAAATVLLVLVVSGDVLLRYRMAQPIGRSVSVQEAVTEQAFGPLLSESRGVAGTAAAAPQVSAEPTAATAAKALAAAQAGATDTMPPPQAIASPVQPAPSAVGQEAADAQTPVMEPVPSRSSGEPAAPPSVVTVNVEGGTPTVMSTVSATIEGPGAGLTAEAEGTLTREATVSAVSSDARRAETTVEPSESASTAKVVTAPAPALPQPTRALALAAAATAEQVPPERAASGQARDGDGTQPPASLFLQPLQRVLPLAEAALGAAVVLLLAATFLLRRRQRTM